MRNSPFPEITMLSATADHAIRAVLVLARADRFMRAEEIAAATGAPHNYMAKTLNALAKTGLVTSARGPAGGFTLAVAPSAIPIARIVDLFDIPRVRTRCMLGSIPCDPSNPCTAHECWTRMTDARREPLLNTTVADLLAGNGALPIAPATREDNVATSTAA
jgi:Rrf2 family transcriptional regulator, iron-sulfur cluster assembly transcription factor